MSTLMQYNTILLLALASVAAGSAAAEANLVDIAAELEPIRQEYDFPALAAAVILDGELHALGVVGIRQDGSEVPAEPDDPFHLGSCTKAMTASLVCLLAQEGKLDWTTTLAEFFPELRDRLHADYRAVTLVHLLSHRARLPSMTNGFAPVNDDQLQEILGRDPRDQRRRVTEIVLSEAPVRQPGEQYLYSNAGYTIAGAIIEKVMDESWENLITERLFAPLGMTTAGFGAMGTTDRIDAPWQHKYRNGRTVPINPGPASDNPPFLGPGGRVHCSMADWARYVCCILKACRQEEGLLPASQYTAVQAPPFDGSYALGWQTCQRAWGGHALTHSGTNTMNHAVAWVAPEKDFAVLVAANRGGDEAAKGLDKVCALMINRFLRKQ
ncbi:MAG: beta-lactamase family protein [Phycisphaerales bacterium]|nr:MAG: beta-lactamase family protein [Phycisphaerales bacterium]